MSSTIALLLIGTAAGLAITVIDRLVAPVVRGWLADRRPADDWLFVAPGTPAARLFDNLLAVALIGAAFLAFRLGGVL